MEKKSYISPTIGICNMLIEGILCASYTDATQECSDLQDYNPSEGAW
ncbi:MAG: hypothetical protein IJN02_02835 [Bacteroidales bacterium]|nr:hypothetical protein [Bacteroidales bacterium]